MRGKIANLESIYSVNCITLLGHVTKLKTSCFDTDFTFQMNLPTLSLIHCFVFGLSSWLLDVSCKSVIYNFFITSNDRNDVNHKFVHIIQQHLKPYLSSFSTPSNGPSVLPSSCNTKVMFVSGHETRMRKEVVLPREKRKRSNQISLFR